MRQPPPETWCQKCQGEGYVIKDEHRIKCLSCDGSGETAESIMWRPPEDDE